MANNWDVNTDDYDIFSQGGETISARQGFSNPPDDYYFPMSTVEQSTMDPDPNNTGPTNDFWTDYPIMIDVNGYIFYNGNNTGINVRGPAGLTAIAWDDLTPEQIAQLKGADGANGQDGQDGAPGADGQNGLSAYEVWLEENGWLDDPEDHPLSDFYQMIADLSNELIGEGTGEGSIITNYHQHYNTASGRGGFACGYYTSANGNNSFTAGVGTLATHSAQFAIGYYNANEENVLFEIGNGHNTYDRTDAFFVTDDGDTFTAGDFIDGEGNILSNKVDKVAGKGLSTFDFNSAYKSFIDDYQIDSTITSNSQNPVTSQAIYSALQEMAENNGRPPQQLQNIDTDFYFLHPSDPSDNKLNLVYYNNTLSWNPSKKTLKMGVTTSNSKVFGFGLGLAANTDNQIVLGKYNNPDSNDALEIGWGSSTNDTINILTLNKQGLLTVNDVVSSNGLHRLSNKQDLLVYDENPTEFSQNIVNSGNLYAYLVAHGLDPEGGFTDPKVAMLQAQITALTSRVTALENLLAEYGNPHEIIDDTYTYNTYRIGIDQDEFYIKLKEEEPEPEEEEQVEENEGE